MAFFRSTVVEFGKKQAKDTATITVRAGSKPGAAITARIAASRIIPVRQQEVIRIENLSNDRFLDKWVVQVQDREDLKNVGQ